MVKQLEEECIETFRICCGMHEFTLFPLHRKCEKQMEKKNFRLLNIKGSHSPNRWIYFAGGGGDCRWKNLKNVTFRQNATVFNTRW